MSLTKFLQAVRGKEFFVLDTETTGIDDGEVVQIAVVHSSGKILLDTLIKPTQAIPNTHIHGITDEMCKNAPSWPEIAENLRHVLQGQLLVVYNAVYDRKMMHKSQERHNQPKIEWKEICEWHCAMEAYAEFYGEWNNYHGNYCWQRLGNAARNCGVKVENAHSAAGDCLMTLGAVKYMLESEADNEKD
jgi:DNA polymerase-3 subunit epsilon